MSNESSLDRFLKSRAVIGLGLGGRRVTMIQSFIGGLMSASGIGVLLAPLMGASADIRGAAIGLLAGGAAMLIGSQAMRRRMGSMGNRDWNLTPEAKTLLLKLVRKQLGWWDANAFDLQPDEPALFITIGGKRSRRVLRDIAWDGGMSGFHWFKTPAQEISSEVLELLDVAAEQFNRIQGILQSPTGSLAKLSSQALVAADEAMAGILHDCATMDKFPESASANRKQIEHRIRGLKELADRLEETATREQTFTEKLGSASSMDVVLEELRLEQLAHSELRQEDEEVRQRLQP